jgi:hypothetical protein
MTLAQILKLCKQAQRDATARAMADHPGQVIRPSGRYLTLLYPYGYSPAFGDYKWDDSRSSLDWLNKQAEKFNASEMAISGVVSVAPDWHYFDINKLTATYEWSVSIPINCK